MAPTYIAGPTRANTAIASDGTVPLARFSVEKAAKKYRSPVTTRARDIQTRARRSRSAEISIRHHVWTRSAQPCTSAISPVTSVSAYATPTTPQPRMTTRLMKSTGCLQRSRG